MNLNRRSGLKQQDISFTLNKVFKNSSFLEKDILSGYETHSSLRESNKDATGSFRKLAEVSEKLFRVFFLVYLCFLGSYSSPIL